MNTSNKPGADACHLDQIRTLYTELAQTPEKDFGWGKGKDHARVLGCADDWLRAIPDVVW